MLKLFSVDKFLKPPYAALFMGTVVAVSLLWTQKGIHVSGLFSFLCSSSVIIDSALSNDLFCSVHSSTENKNWIIWMVAGIFSGAFLSSFWRTHKFKFSIEKGNGVKNSQRLVLAAIGGFLVGGAAALAGGCTSSLGLTGSALFSVASFAFLVLFFIGGFTARIFFSRYWHG